MATSKATSNRQITIKLHWPTVQCTVTKTAVAADAIKSEGAASPPQPEWPSRKAADNQLAIKLYM